MTQHLGEIAVPERAINLTIEGDEDASILPVDAQLLEQLLTNSESHHPHFTVPEDDRHTDNHTQAPAADS